MWRSFVILFIVTTNLYAFLDSYKITTDDSSKTIEAYDNQDSDVREEYAEENNSNDDPHRRSSGRVVIGKWRNNGEALEPKWRDGDSVPLAPFSTISFQSGWGKVPDFTEYHQRDRQTFFENQNRHSTSSSERSNDYTIGRKTPEAWDIADSDQSESASERKETIAKISSSFRDQGTNSGRDEKIHQVQGGGGRYRETLQNYQTEYELFENESDDPRPRKRRPPKNHEFPGPWGMSGDTVQRQSSIANDMRRYLMKNPEETKSNNGGTGENEELKTFLKMQGDNLSLSEILQQKNLTLADLLKGKSNAINILKASNQGITRAPDTRITQTPEEKLSNSTSGRPPWSPRQKMIRKKTDLENTHESTTIKIDQTSPAGDLTTSTIHPASNHSDKGSQESQNIQPNEDVEKEPLRSSETSSNRHPDGLNPENNDEDEIMEFSDYPAKMPKYVAPVYELAPPHIRRKNIPSGSVRMSNATKDTEQRLSIEHILSSEKKRLTKVDNETASTAEDPHKTLNEIATKNSNGDKANEKNEGPSSVEYSNPKDSNKTPDAIESDNANDQNYKNKKGGYPVTKDVGNHSISSRKEVDGVDEGIEKSMRKDTPVDAEEPSIDTIEKNVTLNNKLHEVAIPKVDPQSRAEILELFSSGSSAERLERLLASRNMSVEELIALRQRGSSQVHFAEVFRAKEEASTTLSTPEKTSTSENQTEDNETIHLTEASIQQSTQDSSNAQKVITSKEKGSAANGSKDNQSSGNDSKKNKSEENRSKMSESNDNGSKETFDHLATDLFDLFSVLPAHDKKKPESNTVQKSVKEIMDLTMRIPFDALPGVNDIQRDSQGSAYYTSIEEVKLLVPDTEIEKAREGIFGVPKSGIINSEGSAEIGHVEEILTNDLKSLTNAYGVSGYEYSEKKALSKVKPSIIASGGILGVTIVVFLSIFIACRIRQKKKFAYKNSFTKAVFHNPVMTARKLSNTSSVNTIMVDVMTTSTPKWPQKHDAYESDDFEAKSDLDHDSLDANDSWDTIPDFVKYNNMQ